MFSKYHVLNTQDTENVNHPDLHGDFAAGKYNELTGILILKLDGEFVKDICDLANTLSP